MVLVNGLVMTSYTNIEQRQYIIKPEHLSPESYKILATEYGEAIPFIIAGPAGLAEHKQLNWLNLFITDRLRRDYTILIKAIENDTKTQINKEINKYPSNIPQLLEQTSTAAIDANKPVELTNALIIPKLNQIENRLNKFELKKPELKQK